MRGAAREGAAEWVAVVAAEDMRTFPRMIVGRIMAERRRYEAGGKGGIVGYKRWRYNGGFINDLPVTTSCITRVRPASVIACHAA